MNDKAEVVSLNKHIIILNDKIKKLEKRLSEKNIKLKEERAKKNKSIRSYLFSAISNL